MTVTSSGAAPRANFAQRTGLDVPSRASTSMTTRCPSRRRLDDVFDEIILGVLTLHRLSTVGGGVLAAFPLETPRASLEARPSRVDVPTTTRPTPPFVRASPPSISSATMTVESIPALKHNTSVPSSAPWYGWCSCPPKMSPSSGTSRASVSSSHSV